jgi:hypothetical protein
MANYFDKQGNVYRIDDPKVLTKKEHIDVWSEDGEAFTLPAKVAIEHKLTAEEKAQVITALSERIAELIKVIGTGGGCPVIDPVGPWTVSGTHAATQQLANLAQGIFGGGCRAIDPPGLASILGTQVLPQQNELLTAMLRARLGGCPNIDPANQLSMLGTLAQLAATPAAAAQRPASSGCPNIDPANIGTLVGTLAQLAARPQANAFANLFGGGCPNIDPVQIGSMLGTLAALGGLRS